MKYLVIASVLLLGACVNPIDKNPSEQVDLIPKIIISAHMDAFNEGDVAGMSKMQHQNIEWLNIENSILKTEVSGRNALAKSMETYFQSPSRVKGTLTNWNLNGDYVSVTETAKWKSVDGEPKSQSALTIYQMEDNLIRRVWYFPAVEN
jgi:hypothetical protein